MNGAALCVCARACRRVDAPRACGRAERRRNGGRTEGKKEQKLPLAGPTRRDEPRWRISSASSSSRSSIGAACEHYGAVVLVDAYRAAVDTIISPPFCLRRDDLGRGNGGVNARDGGGVCSWLPGIYFMRIFEFASLLGVDI